MSAFCRQRIRRTASPPERRRGRAADVLMLAASPTFAMMALLTAAPGGPPDMLCSSAPPSPLGGMATMYLLMSAFHTAPWLKLIGEKIRSPVLRCEWRDTDGDNGCRRMFEPKPRSPLEPAFAARPDAQRCGGCEP